MPGWQRNIVHTFLADAPRDRRPPAGDPSRTGRDCRTPAACSVAARVPSSSAAASPGWPRPPGSPNAVSQWRSWSARRIWAAGSAAGPSILGRRHDRVAMNRGFHAFFRQYYNLRDLLRRTDPDLIELTRGRGLPADRRATVGGTASVDCPGRRRWNALAFALRSPTFRLRDLARINARAAAPLAAVSVPDDLPAARRHRRRDLPARHQLSRSPPGTWPSRCSPAASSPTPPQLSAAELATMFHIYFLGSSEGLVFDVADDDFDTALWEPLRTYLSHAASRSARRTVPRRASAARTFQVHCDSGAPVRGRRRRAGHRRGRRCDSSWTARPRSGDADWRTRVDGLRTAPPFTVQRLWLDRPVELRSAGVPRHRRALHRWTTSAWSAPTNGRPRSGQRAHGGSVVELHAYAVDDAPEAGAAPAAGAPARALSRDSRRRASSANASCTARTVPGSARATSPAGRRGDTASRPRPGRRRHPHRSAGGVDGARGHHRLGGRQPAARRTSASAATTCTPFRPRAVRRHCDVLPVPGKAAELMSVRTVVASRWAKTNPFTLLPSADWTLRRPTYRDAVAGHHRGRAQRGQPPGRAATGIMLRGQRRRMRDRRPFGTTVAGNEIVAWRSADGDAARRTRQLPASRCRPVAPAPWTAAR